MGSDHAPGMVGQKHENVELFGGKIQFSAMQVDSPVGKVNSKIPGFYALLRRSACYAWWLVLYPGLAIFSTVTAFNLIGDRFRDALDPRSD